MSSRMGQVIVRLASEAGAKPVVLGPGALIGRHGLCALRVDDPRLSEVHAVLRQRGRRMHLAAIGGVLRVGGAPIRDLQLRPGLRVQLLPGVILEVLTVARPAEVLALQVGDLPPQELVDGCYSVLRSPVVDLVPGQLAGALAQVIDSGDSWRVLLPGGEAPVLRPGKTFQVRRVPIHALTLPTRSNRAWASVPGQWRADPLALRFEAQSEVVHIERATRHDLALTGRSAELLRALHGAGGTLTPAALAQALWPAEEARFVVAPQAVRRRLARAVEELRTVLRSHGVRDDLVRDDGVGNVELYLLAQDGLRDPSAPEGPDPLDPEGFFDEELFAADEPEALPWVPLLSLHGAPEAEPPAPAPADPGPQTETETESGPEPETEELLFSLEPRPEPPARCGPPSAGEPPFSVRTPAPDLGPEILFSDFGAEAPPDLVDELEEATQVFPRSRLRPQEDP